jgi:hypothetical protein
MNDSKNGSKIFWVITKQISKMVQSCQHQEPYSQHFIFFVTYKWAE